MRGMSSTRDNSAGNENVTHLALGVAVTAELRDDELTRGPAEFEARHKPELNLPRIRVGKRLSLLEHKIKNFWTASQAALPTQKFRKPAEGVEGRRAYR